MFGQSTPNQSNRQVCSFYQKGNCKYGSRCYNFHPGAAPGGGFGNAPLNSGRSKEFMEFVGQVATEMTLWESSGMWLLSVLSPLKEHPPLIDFCDTSPEELRVEAYDAMKLNNTAAYQAKVREKLDLHKKLRDAFKSDTPDAMEVLKAVFYKTGEASFSKCLPNQSSGSLFGKSSDTSLFGHSSSSTFGSKPQTSAFGGPPLMQSSLNPGFGGSAFKNVTGSTFGGQAAITPASGSLFGGNTNNNSSSVFGGLTNQPQRTDSNIFSSSQSSNSSFGATSQSTSNVFGSGNTAQTSGNIFGNMSQAQGTGMVRGTQHQPASVFGNTDQSSGKFGFGNDQSQRSGSIFNIPTQNATFGNSAPNAQNTVFGNQTQMHTPNSLFGNQQQGGSILGNVNTTTGNPSSNNAFGGNTQSSSGPNVFGQAPVAGSFTIPTQSSNFASISNPSSVFNANASNSSSLMKLLSNPPTQPPSQNVETPLQSSIPTQASGNLPGNTVAVIDVCSLYTPLEQLSTEDRREFENNTFTRIPLCPPPKQFCV